ncbi:MAG: prephenate dehydratase [Bacteroides sp.]|nr:MAG: prephenate dehydratase [Bacteroides sp.]
MDIIAIQGEETSFHSDATNIYFGNKKKNVIYCSEFKNVFELIDNNKSHYGVIAISNSIAGPIISNYILLNKYKFNIIGEVYLPIKLNLLALKDINKNDIQYIQSHSMAIKQCEIFINKYFPNVKKINKQDTAACSREIYEKKLKKTAAIANYKTAIKYKLNILNEDIADNKLNYTRFIVINKLKSNNYLNANKSSIIIEISFHKSSNILYNIFKILNDYEINISYIQLIPTNLLSDYKIFIDLEWKNYISYIKSLTYIKKYSKYVFVLGIYNKFNIKTKN